MVIRRTPYLSYAIGRLTKGCRLCVKGKKLVLFVTGLCNSKCYFCPISNEKYQRDVIYADEWPVSKQDDIVTEARLIGALGAGITGGDPLIKLDRTIRYIRLLKRRFGKSFHIHLYTPLILVNEINLKRLYDAGLDEIRFHPDIDNPKLWNLIELGKGFKWKFGVEIPAIPKKERETKRLIKFLSKINIDFLNINELEISDNSHSKLIDYGYRSKNSLSYAVRGSEETALRLLSFAEGKIANVHYCTATLKDKFQLANRIKNRAKNVSKDFDIVHRDGTITRGAIYLNEIKPSFGYNKRIESIRNNKNRIRNITTKLSKIKSYIESKYDIPENMIMLDKNMLRILTSPKLARMVKRDLCHRCHSLKYKKNKKNELSFINDLSFAIVTEYPTYDSFIVDLLFL